MKRRLALVIVGAFLGGGLLLAATRLDAQPAALARADEDFNKASAERGVAAWIAAFADDARIFPATGPIVHGLPAIREKWEKGKFSPAGLSWRPDFADVAASGDLGYTVGYWEKPGKDKEGRPVVARGKYLTVWRRQADGKWKVVADVGSEDIPEPPKP